MLKVVSVQAMRQIEAAADSAGLSYAQMMQNAGRATARCALEILAHLDQPHVTVLVGQGNNGGDGLVAAGVMAEESRTTVTCYLLKNRDADPLLDTARNTGSQIINAADDENFEKLRAMLEQTDLILDALFGIGIRLPLRDPAAALLRVVKQAVERRKVGAAPSQTIVYPAAPTSDHNQQRAPFVLAVDCPSGLDCDTGQIDDNALSADMTITFIAAKPGLLAFPGAAAVGQLIAATIGIPADLPALAAQNTELADADMAEALLPLRQVDSNKGSFGKVLIIGGSPLYRGAVALSARAAYRVGAGLVTVGAPESVVNAMAGSIQEATWLPHIDDSAIDPTQLNLTNYDALLVGPGWGRSQPNSASLNALLHQANTLPPLVVDADGLNLLSELAEWWTRLPPNTVITPHPGEMARLSGLAIPEIQAKRLEIAAQKASDWGVTLILKGAHTIIASPSSQVTILPFKTDALAKAGTGDVLAGAVVGFLAQGLKAHDAAVLAGYVHGLAGELQALRLGTTRSVLAGEVADALPEALTHIENYSLIET